MEHSDHGTAEGPERKEQRKRSNVIDRVAVKPSLIRGAQTEAMNRGFNPSIDPARRRQLRSWAPGEKPWLLQNKEGANLLDLASNDYLGLSRHPNLRSAAETALMSDGLGAGGSRLVSGTRPRHLELERSLASWLGRDQVLLFPSGFQANIAAVSALCGRHSTVLADRLIHHSLLVGVRTSGARLQRFAHNDLEIWSSGPARAADATAGDHESLFSMEGTSPPLEAMGASAAAMGHGMLTRPTPWGSWVLSVA